MRRRRIPTLSDIYLLFTREYAEHIPYSADEKLQGSLLSRPGLRRPPFLREGTAPALGTILNVLDRHRALYMRYEWDPVTLRANQKKLEIKTLSDEEKEALRALTKEDPLVLGFYVLRELRHIREIPEEEFEKQWRHRYTYLLDTAKTGLCLDEFPSGPKYVYVKDCTGSVTLRFNSQNSPAWTLATKDQFRLPFDQLYLTWTAQAGKRLTFYVSNREIKRTTLA
ncbi:hypothetical protein E3J48_08250 [Candidatus Aerophobetes bacterium]|uniref:Uncharacterized protein n=1 Tax=Aerophobetes bacterium TaxID=2030807 RepID=A0A523VWH6_UNCAE|nr:MAG: hypothetical protein E3J48_08250 [Candidatus Aerophobetes bacterium]